MNLQFEHKLDDQWNSNILNSDSGTIEVTNWTSNRVPGAADDLLIPAGQDVVQQGQVQHTSINDAAHTLTVANGASLSSRSYLDITGDFVNAGSTTITDDEFRVAGTISNDGIITINSSGNAVLKLTSASQRLIGGGQIILQTPSFQGYFPGIVSTVPGGVLENASTIVGNGKIGGFQNEGSLILHNNAGGVVEANNAPGPVDSSFQTHVLYITGGAGANNASEAVVNQGTLRASTGGSLVLIQTHVQNAGGTIDGNGGKVYLSYSTVFGGTITGTGGVAVFSNGGDFSSGSVGRLDGSTDAGVVHNQGLVYGAGLSLKGTIDNSGTIRAALTGNGSNVVLQGAVTFTGGGAIDLVGGGTNAGQIAIIGNSSTLLSTLINVDNTIRGAGQVGGNRLLLDNRAGGTVDGNNASQPTRLALSDGIANAGTLQASAAGGLLIDHTTVTSTSAGRIQAVGSTAHVDLFGSTVVGGILASSGGGVIQTTAYDFTVLDGSTSAGAVTNNGTFVVNDQTRLSIKGSLVNNGTLTDRRFIGIDAAGASLSGTGTLQLAGLLEGTSTSTVATLRNASTIAGYGFLGSAYDYNGTDGRLRVQNLAAGIINATSTTSELQLRSPDGMANAGLMEATAGGFLRLEVINVDQTGGGVIKAVGAGSHVDVSGSTITGGTVGSTGSGVVNVTNTSGGSVLDGSTTTGAVGLIGMVNVNPNSNLTLKGAVQNAGTVQVQAGPTGGGNSGSVLYVDRSGVTLRGGGTVVIGAVPTNSSALVSNTAGVHTVLTNVDNTIAGAGFLGQNNGIGADDFMLMNGGTVNANQSGYTLTLRTGQVVGAGPTTTNTGLLEATGGGTLLISDTSVQSKNASLYAGTGSVVKLANSVIYGGTFASDGTGIFEAIDGSSSTINGASVGGAVTNLGTIQVDARGYPGSQAMLAIVGDVTNNGHIRLVGGTDYGSTLNLGAVLTGTGSVDLSNTASNRIVGSVTNGTNTIAGAGTISATVTNLGGGTIAATYAQNALVLSNTTASLANDGVLKADGGTLRVNSNVTGSGTGVIAHGGVLDAEGTFNQNVTFQDATGILKLTHAYTGTISGFKAGDSIDLAFVPFNAGTPPTDAYDPAASGGTLTVKPATGAAVTLKLPGFDDAGLFRLASDGAGGTLLTLSADPTPRLVLNFTLGQATLSRGAGGVQVITGPDGAHVLPTGVTSIRFTDGKVDEVPEGPDGLVDPLYYDRNNLDVYAAGVDPAAHYAANGFREGRNPNELFDIRYYLDNNPDVAAAGIDPLAHFASNGWREGRNPSAAFDVRDYQAANPDVAAAGIDPLAHYLASGRPEGRAAYAVSNQPKDPLFDSAYYYAHNPDVKAAGVDAQAHFNASGYLEGRTPNAYFDPGYYLAQNPDVRAAGLNPLAHFEASGFKEGREPSLVFSDAKYLDANPDVRAAGLDPLAHYLSSGQAEGRMAFLTGGTAPADPLVVAGYYDRQLGASLVPGGTEGAQQAAWSYDHGGWQSGLNPDAFFDSNYYLSHNADVAAAHINPLLHYEANGWHEGRDPSAQFSTNKYLAAYSDVRDAGIDPLLHYVAYGQAEGRTAFPV